MANLCTTVHRVSLREVAAHLGISHSTVSRALRNDRRISKTVRTLVHDACRALGYRPNSIISELAASRWQLGKVGEGIVIAFIDCTRIGTPIGEAHARFLGEYAAKLGYQLETFKRQEFSATRLQRLLRNRGITDVILGPVYEEELKIELDWDKFICVQLSPGFFSQPLHSVTTDHYEGVILAWQRVVRYGYRRIGFRLFTHPFSLMDDFKRESAVETCQKKISPELEAIPSYQPSAGGDHLKHFSRWVDEHRLDAVIAFNRSQYEIYCANIDFPFAVLNKDSEEGAAGVTVPTKAFASEAVGLLHYCRRTYQWGIPQRRINHVIEPQWSDGYSMPAKAASMAQPLA